MIERRIFAIGDTHAFHERIILPEYENRPFIDMHDMNAKLIQFWNETVTDDDIVIHLGDVGLGRADDLRWFVGQLKGIKILIMGNHDRDRSSAFYVKAWFIFATKNSMRLRNCILSHEPYVDPEKINFHGHIHSARHRKFDLTANHVNLSADVTNFRPVLLDRQYITVQDLVDGGVLHPSLYGTHLGIYGAIDF